ncbi:MAG: entericidin A/B family lipoprotein [Nitrospiraceae bacterium]
MRRVISILIALLLIVLAGCATFRGMAQDTENLGRGIKKTVSE